MYAAPAPAAPKAPALAALDEPTLVAELGEIRVALGDLTRRVRAFLDSDAARFEGHDA